MSKRAEARINIREQKRGMKMLYNLHLYMSKMGVTLMMMEFLIMRSFLRYTSPFKNGKSVMHV